MVSFSAVRFIHRHYSVACFFIVQKRMEIVDPKSEIVSTESDNQTPVHLADKTLKTSSLHIKSPRNSARINALSLSHKSVFLHTLISFLA